MSELDDVQTTVGVIDGLRARIAELEAANAVSFCVFCGNMMEKDLTVMLEHARGCEDRPENRLMGRIAELEAINASTYDDLCSMTGAYERAEQAEAALAERDARQCATCEHEIDGVARACGGDVSVWPDDQTEGISDFDEPPPDFECNRWAARAEEGGP